MEDGDRHWDQNSTHIHTTTHSTPVDIGFFPVETCGHSVPKTPKEVYINYKRVGLLAQASY